MSDIFYSSTTCNFKNYCAAGRRHRLYASWGTMQHWLKDPEYVIAMAIAFHDGIPIGMAMLMKDMSDGACSRFGVFVRKGMRRQGIGKHLVSLIKKRSGQGFMVAKWYPEQAGFFDALGMRGYRE